MSLLAYHAMPGLKLHYLRKAEFHEWTDSFEKGLYWDPKQRRGCAVGCWSHDPFGGHAALAKAMGVPEELLRLADGIFEALLRKVQDPNREAPLAEITDDDIDNLFND